MEQHANKQQPLTFQIPVQVAEMKKTTTKSYNSSNKINGVRISFQMAGNAWWTCEYIIISENQN